jgi:hypothetical protein
VDGKIWRHPVGGLAGGYSGDARNAKTTESARSRAIVLVHACLDPARSIQILLHFHGLTSRPGDPYPGWRQRRLDGAVRDVALDRWTTDKRGATRGNFEHHDAAKTGIMDLPKEVVGALVSAGLSWGGAYAGGKDIMHFDWRRGTIRGRPVV